MAICPGCGKAVPENHIDVLCAGCRAKITRNSGAPVDEDPDTIAFQATVELPDGWAKATAASPGNASRLPVPGETFGPYRILRLLGAGGMGRVYEAEHRDLGRRLALKVLNADMMGKEDRARFLREGQTAAAVNHPNTVYIFGSDEIEGNPVIAMELLPGGTLQDRIANGGAMPVDEAVTAIQQVIAGLEAAHDGGILHRDVKPANCFLDRDGTVKVGDFGLSIPQVGHDVTKLTQMGMILGTPQFASPEQLKGDPLDLRADIYSVGATMYYLLTGKAPFEAKDLMTLLTKVAAEAPPDVRKERPEVPAAFAALLLRCLAKDPAHRPPTYAALSEELEPFGARTEHDASPWARLGAFIVDYALILPVLVTLISILDKSPLRSHKASHMVIVNVLIILYFSLAENHWGFTIGKYLFNLKILDADGKVPSLIKSILRSTILFIPFMIPDFFYGAVPLYIGPITLVAMLLVLFSKARKENGFLGLHEMATGTHVVEGESRSGARSGALRFEAETLRADGPMVGAFQLLAPPGPGHSEGVFLAWDKRLRRRVWIRRLPPESPAVRPERQILQRRTRLRWLAGQRSDGECWDAFENPGGQALLDLLPSRQPWANVRIWLRDLAEELKAAAEDGSLPELGLDRVWIDQSGHARLLEWPAPGSREPDPAADPVSLEPRAFLVQVAVSVLSGQAKATWPDLERLTTPMPIHAWNLLEGWRKSVPESIEAMAAELVAIQGKALTVPRWKRAIPILACSVLPVAMTVLSLIFTAVRDKNDGNLDNQANLVAAFHRLKDLDGLGPAREADEEKMDLEVLLFQQLEEARTDPMKRGIMVAALRPFPDQSRRIQLRAKPTAQEFQDANRRLGPWLRREGPHAAARDLDDCLRWIQEAAEEPGVVADRDRRHLEIYVSTRLREAALCAIANPSATPRHALAAQALAKYGSVPESEAREAVSRVETRLALRQGPRLKDGPMLMLAYLVPAALLNLLLAPFTRFGLAPLILGLALVGRGGRASRLRAVWRALITWSPLPLMFGLLWMRTRLGWPVEAVLAITGGVLACLVAGAAWSILDPRQRGPQDRLAGTWVVPR